MHIVPRYSPPRTFTDLTFDDPDYPPHYSVPAPARKLPLTQVEALIGPLRAMFE